MPGPFLRIDPLWFDSCKQPPPVSNHSVFAFWVVACGRFKSCNCNQAGTFENTRKVSLQWSLFKTVFYFSFLGSFSTASCTNCKHQVSCEVIREEIFQQVCTLLRVHQLKHWGCWKKYRHNPKKIACYSNLSGALWQSHLRNLNSVSSGSPVAPHHLSCQILVIQLGVEMSVNCKQTNFPLTSEQSSESMAAEKLGITRKSSSSRFCSQVVEGTRSREQHWKSGKPPLTPALDKIFCKHCGLTWTEIIFRLFWNDKFDLL